VSYRPDLTRLRAHARNIVMGYSDEALNGAIDQLRTAIVAGTAQSWEKKRHAALCDERDRRDRNRRGKDAAR